MCFTGLIQYVSAAGDRTDVVLGVQSGNSLLILDSSYFSNVYQCSWRKTVHWKPGGLKGHL